MTEARKATGWTRGLAQLMLPLMVGAALLLTVLAIGQKLAGGGPTVTFREIECDPPAGMTRQQFLEETQYLSGFPDRLKHPSALREVHDAFGKHPWVLRVVRVQILRGGVASAELVYRRPVLAVASPPREVDDEGILLPRSDGRKGLPLLTTKVAAPVGKPGRSWGDVRVAAVAQVVALVHPRLPLAECTVEIDEGEVMVRGPKWRVLWGRPSGQEKAGEATADEKLRRLADAALVGTECDVRPVAGMKQRPLPP